MSSSQRAGPAATLLAVSLLWSVFALSTTADEQATTGTLIGSVTLHGKDERRRPPRYYRGSYRAAHDTATVSSPLESVVIYIHGVSPPSTGWPTPGSRQMRQEHDTFIPHVLPILRGTTVAFPNADNYYHNVFSVVAGERFDLGRYGEGSARQQRFDQGAVIVVRCEIHPGMKAYILVRDNPHFTVADAAGHFTLTVPAGEQRVVGWHPTRGRVERTVHISGSDTLRIDLSL